jgi:L-fuculose-phosphate aldolase
MSEIYSGVKFKEVQIGIDPLSHLFLPELIKWCTVFSEKAYAPPYPGGSSGNLSFRSISGENKFIITTSYTKLGVEMTERDFVEVVECIPEENTILYNGVKSPSSESFMHDYIYKNKPEINAVFHGHSDDIMNIARKKGYPQTLYEAPYGTLELAESIIDVIGNYTIIIIKNHGFVTIGKTLDEAGKNVLQL